MKPLDKQSTIVIHMNELKILLEVCLFVMGKCTLQAVGDGTILVYVDILHR